MCPRLLSFVLVMIAACTAAAETNKAANQPPSVMLNVVATGSDGKTVPDLTANDFRVSDNGSPQQITSFHLNRSNGPRALVILFDLLNLNLENQGYEWQQIKRSVPEMPASDFLYLYLLVKDGSLYPVHALPTPDAEGAPPDASWIQNVGPLLDAAMQKVNQLRPIEIQTQVGVRFEATVKALSNLGARMAAVKGRKELVWVTYGVPSSIHLVGGDWFDCAPLLRQLAMRFNQSNTAIYTMDPAMNLGRGVLNRDAMRILTENTGGHSFTTSDIRTAAVSAVADARTNYSIQYVPSASNWNGKFHQVRVACERKGIHIQTEKGYFAVAPPQ